MARALRYGAVLLAIQQAYRAAAEDEEEVDQLFGGEVDEEEDDGESVCHPDTPELCSEEENKTKETMLQYVDAGNHLAQKGEYWEALKIYKAAIKMDSTSAFAANPMVNSGLALKYLGYKDRALEHLRAGVKLNPNLFHAQLNLANELADQLVWDEADEAYKKSLELAPDAQTKVSVGSGYARLLASSYHYEDGRDNFEGRDVFAEAAEQIQPTIDSMKQDTTPVDAPTVSGLTKILERAGKLAEAQELNKFAVSKGVWKDIRQRPLNFDKDFAAKHKATPFWKVLADLPDFLDEVSEEKKKFVKEINALIKDDKLNGAHEEDFQWIDQSKGHEWKQLTLFWDGKKDVNNSKIAKTAAKIFSETPLVGDNAADMSYNVLTPGTRTFPRCGLSNARLTCHFGLSVPTASKEKLGISVDGELAAWKQGAWLCFDDSFEHSFYNELQEPVSFIAIHFKHPLMNPTVEPQVSRPIHRGRR